MTKRLKAVEIIVHFGIIENMDFIGNRHQINILVTQDAPE